MGGEEEQLTPPPPDSLTADGPSVRNQEIKITRKGFKKADFYSNDSPLNMVWSKVVHLLNFCLYFASILDD